MKAKLKVKIVECDETYLDTEFSPPQIHDNSKEADIPGDIVSALNFTELITKVQSIALFPVTSFKILL